MKYASSSAPTHPARKQFFILILAVLFVLPAALKAELVFTAPPREKPEQGQKIYGPLAEALSKALGEKVVYEHPKDWITYSFNMRKGRYAFVFDGPHFGAWRMVNLGHVPLVALPGALQFHLITRSDSRIKHLEDLNGKQVCGLPPPNLGSMSILSQYDNPVRQPLILAPKKGGFPQVYQEWLDGKCEAAILRNAFFKTKIPDNIKAQIRIVYSSPAMPNQTLTASNEIDGAQRETIIKQLTHADSAAGVEPLLQRFSKNSTALIAADPQGYAGLNLLLEGRVWGW